MPRMTYHQIADDLAARVIGGEYPPGTKLPTHRELAALYSVSGSTIEKVVLLLRARGLIYGEQGVGIFVVEDPPNG